MTGVLIVAIVFGALVAMQWIKMISRERESEGALHGGAVGLTELEERMQQAVAAAIEPLREQIRELEEKVEQTRPDRLLSGEREEGQEP